MGIPVKLEAFEGPLDLLLHLIEKNKINIYDIPIVEITEQYLEYVNAMEGENLDVVSEFLVMAATLADIKAKMLLPKQAGEEDEGEDPRDELVQKLLEYKMYKYMSYELKDREHDAGRAIYRSMDVPDEVLLYKPPVDVFQLLSDITLQKLNDIYKSVMKKQIDKIDPVRSKFGKIEKEEINLGEKVKYIINCISSRGKCSFRKLLNDRAGKMNVIVSFLAILELMRLGAVTVTQSEIFDDMEISAANTDILNTVDLEVIIEE